MIDLDKETAWTVLYGLGMLALGVWFGTQLIGRLVARSTMAAVAGASPGWVETVQTVNHAVLAIFVICMLGVVACDYYADGDSEESGA